ncbi:MAG TPA: GNAT family N-acetyltransferase [Terrimesophilobacter sp.]|nr:GNAT family N-acetyltransferase [Terrimesophilobacter sp.]
MADVENRSEFAHYTRLRPERGDFGFWFADDTGGWMSVVWLLFLPARGPGYGFVRDGVPELSVCTRAEHRGRGLGRELMTLALGEARGRGVGAVSLSAEPDNPALRLYESLGFMPVADAPAGTMIVHL